MKKAISLILIVIMLLTIVACNTNNGDKPLTENTINQNSHNEALLSETSSIPKKQPQESTDEVISETVLTDFTVEIYPALESKEPIDDPLVTFTLEIPSNWIVEEDTTYQYVYHEGNNELPYIAIIEGFHKVSDPAKPFEDVKKFPSTISITELNIAAYPVLCHIMQGSSADKPYFAYIYYVFAEDELISIELISFDNSPQTQEKFDEIISSFVLK